MSCVRVALLGPYEWGPFFEHFYRKTDLSFFESLATAGLFYLRSSNVLMKKRKMQKNFFRRGGIWTLLFRKILIFKCLRRLIFQRSVRSGFIIKCNVLFHASSKTLFRGVLSAVRLFFFEGCKECSASALSCGWPVAEKDCFVPHSCSSSINAPEVYCLPLSLWKVRLLGSPRSRYAFRKVVVTSLVLALRDTR